MENISWGFHGLNFLCLFSEVAQPPARAIRPQLQTTLLVVSLFLLSSFISLQVMEMKEMKEINCEVFSGEVAVL